MTTLILTVLLLITGVAARVTGPGWAQKARIRQDQPTPAQRRVAAEQRAQDTLGPRLDVDRCGDLRLS